MDRREFLAKAALAATLLGVTVTVTSCNSNDSPTGVNSNGDVTGSATGSGHTHSGVITKVQLDAGAAVTITFSGSGHTHHLALTDTEVHTIASGQRVQKTVVTPPPDQQHPHTYTFH